jgi:tetratricopeptide (TPR) repeat protein
MLALGDAYEQGGDPAAAITAWQSAAALPGADLIQVYTRLESAYQANADLDSLHKTLTQHAAAAPQDAQVLYRLGLIETVLSADQASGHLNQASLLDSGLSARVHAIQTGLILAGKTPDASYRLLLIGRALGSAGEWSTALLAFERAIALNPKNFEALAFRGEALNQLGKDGYPDLEKAVQAAPESVLIQALQAVYWLRDGKPERALVYLHAAARQEPDNPVWQVDLGNALAAMGSLDDAARSYQAATQIAPKDPAYWRLLAGFCLRYQYLVRDMGLPAARQAVLLNDKDPASLDLMGQVFSALNDMLSAERFFQRAIQAAPDSADAHFHLGYVLLQEGDTQAARDQLLLASKLQPDTNAGQQASRLLKQYFP